MKELLEQHLKGAECNIWNFRAKYIPQKQICTVWFGAGLGCLSAHSVIISTVSWTGLWLCLSINSSLWGTQFICNFHGSVTHHQNIRFSAQSKPEEPLPQPSWVMSHALLSKIFPRSLPSNGIKKRNYNWRAGMDGLMQNHLNKTIIIINDRQPVASSAKEKRTNHRERPSEQLPKLHFSTETRDRKEPPNPSPTPKELLAVTTSQQTFPTGICPETTLKVIFLDNCYWTLKLMGLVF